MLVGRESERQVIQRLLAGARTGSSGTLVLTGEAGIGKSALMAEAESLAGPMRVLRARGTESERDIAFGGLLQLLRPVLGSLDQIPDPQADALSRALALRPGPAGDRFAVCAATLSVVCRAAEDVPLLLLVDDLHLVDHPSVEALVFAARRLVADSAAMVMAMRPDEIDEKLVADIPRLAVSGLPRSDADQLIAHRSLPGDQITRLHTATAGNPLAMLEIAADTDTLARLPADAPLPVPSLIATAFARRAQELSTAARAVLLLAAVDDHDVALLARAADHVGGDTAALGEAEQAGLIRLVGDRVEFRHPLVRSAVYASADPSARRAAHRAIAGALDPAQADRRAWHLAAAALGPDPDIARLLIDTAESAHQRGAFAVASRHAERAAELSLAMRDRATRLTFAGRTAWLAGLADRAVELLDRATDLTETPATRAEILALRGSIAARCGSLEGAQHLLRTAAADSADSDPDNAVLYLAEAIYACFYLGDAGAAKTAASQIDALASRLVTARARILGSMSSGMALILAGHGDEGAARLRGALAALVSHDELRDDSRWRGWLVAGPVWLRESGTNRQLIESVVDDAREHAAMGMLPFLLFHVARDDATTDRWTTAESGFLEAIRLARESGLRSDLAASLAGLAWLLARQGRDAEALAHAASATDLCERSHLHLGRCWIHFALGDLASGAGNSAEAVVHYLALERLLGDIGVVDPDLSPAPELVELYVRTGRPEVASTTADAFYACAAAKGQPWALARATRALAIAGIAPDRNFEAALAHHADTLDVYETARTELAFGAYLRRHRQRAAARPHLRTALATFDALAARPWSDAAASELAATGETVRRRGQTGAQQLTPQERQIATLLAGGRTTREAAAALFLSPKTVEYHLRHVYIKLDISSRRELAALMDAATTSAATTSGPAT